jgi:hypothetical protein
MLVDHLSLALIFMEHLSESDFVSLELILHLHYL